MNEEYRGIYFQNKNSVGPQKIFYEHGAHFEYMALYKILKDMIKKITPRINSSLPKKKNVSKKRKNEYSFKRQKLITKIYDANINKQNQIKVNLSNLSIKKVKNNKRLNNSLFMKQKRHLSCEKNINDISYKNKNKNLNLKNSVNKQHIKNNSSLNNNSIEYLFNDNRLILSESFNSNYKEKKGFTNLNKICKNNLKFNAIALTDFSKKNDNIIFSYNKKYNKNNSDFMNKYENNKYFTEKNKNLITKENKKLSNIITINQLNLKEESHKNIIDSGNIKNINFIKANNNIKSGIKLNYSKKISNNIEYLDNLTHIKTPKYNYNINNIKNNKKKYINNNKNNRLSQKQNLNKTSNNEKLKLQKNAKKLEKYKMKVSRNINENLKTINSYFNQDKKNQLTLHNYQINNLGIKNETEKINFNIDNPDIIKEEEKIKTHSMERRDIKRYIKNKILEKNDIKLADSTKNENKKKLNKPEQENQKRDKHYINYFTGKKGDNCLFTGSTKSNNDSVNKSKSNKNGDKKSIISTNLTSHINSNGIIIPLHKKKIYINNNI